MVKQYPHKLTATIVSGSTQDENGNWVPGTSETKEADCRAEANGRGDIIHLSDGSQYVFAWIVYMPKGATPIPEGAEVTATSSPAASGQVKRFSQGQLNSRLWL